MTAATTCALLNHHFEMFAKEGVTSANQQRVLGFLVGALEETQMIAEGDLTVRYSRYEIQSALGLTESQVKTALGGLVAAGCIDRDQPTKKDGVTARTLLLPKALRLMGCTTADVPKNDVPSYVSGLLIGEDLAVIKAVTDAWAETAPCPVSIESLYRGGSHKLEQLQMVLAERHVAHQEKILEAVEAQDARRAADERGEHELTLPDGVKVVLSRDRFKEAAGGGLANLSDMRFNRDAIERLIEIAPKMVTLKTLPRLLADIAYSRTNGFVRTKDATQAIRILASCIQRPTWSKPRKMSNHWYTAASAAVIHATC